MALSSTEAEYMTASQANCEALWLRKLMVDFFDMELSPTIIQCDNQSCIKLSENPVFHDRSKRIEIRYHFIRDYVQRGAVRLQYVPTDEQVANILTKSLGRGKHVYFRDKLEVVKNTFLNNRECLKVTEEGVFHHSQLVSEIEMLPSTQRLCKNVSYLLICRDIL